MTSEDFWKNDPNLFVSYRISFINKEKRNHETINYSKWLGGLYIFDGFVKALKMFANQIFGNNSKVDEYPSKPYNLFENKNDSKKLKEKTIEKKNKNNLNFYASKKNILNKRKED